jgi:hypothetical protein
MGSKEERVLLGLPLDFMASRTPEDASTTENEGTDRLKEIVYYIKRRECFPSDLARRRFSEHCRF